MENRDQMSAWPLAGKLARLIKLETVKSKELDTD